MRATCRSTRHACARHNDRNFDLEQAEHIDQEKVKNNYYWHIDRDKSLSFDEMELKYYKKHFSEYLNERNERNRANGHKERVITMDSYRKKAKSCPEEVLLQIGSVKDGTVSEQMLFDCMRQYVIEFNKKYGHCCTVLNLALHLDETTPHVHIRRVWHVHDREGHEVVNQKQGLAELGFVRPNLEKKEDRHNNAKIPFSKAERELFLDICEEHGLKLEREPLEGRKRLETDVFKLQQQLEQKEVELQAKENEIRHLEKLVKQLQALLESLNQGVLSVAKKVVKEHNRDQGRVR